jgi:hypothetical protein
MPRAYWNGYLRLSLVTCPIELFPATSQTEKTHFHQINTQTGHRLRQQLVDEETGKVVDAEHKGRGYELTKGKYVEIDDSELQAIQVESTRTLDIDAFVPRADIDKRYLDKPYYIAPNGKPGAEAFVVIRDAMQDEERVALGRIVMAQREHIMMLGPARKRFARNDAAIRLRGPQREGVFRGNSIAAHHKGHGFPCVTYPPKQGGQVRPGNSKTKVKSRCASSFSARPKATRSNRQSLQRSQAT